MPSFQNVRHGVLQGMKLAALPIVIIAGQQGANWVSDVVLPRLGVTYQLDPVVEIRGWWDAVRGCIAFLCAGVAGGVVLGLLPARRNRLAAAATGALVSPVSLAAYCLVWGGWDALPDLWVFLLVLCPIGAAVFGWEWDDGYLEAKPQRRRRAPDRDVRWAPPVGGVLRRWTAPASLPAQWGSLLALLVCFPRAIFSLAYAEWGVAAWSVPGALLSLFVAVTGRVPAAPEEASDRE
jgi:hypothetical protein